MRIRTATGLLLLASWVPGWTTAQELSPSAVFEAAAPSVVVVNGIDQTGAPLLQGSGVVIGRGVVVSNCHVFKGAKTAQVIQHGATLSATLLHADTERDLCSFTVPGLNAPAARLGSSSGLKVGARAYAIGAPRGFDLTLSDGLISSFRPVEGGALLQITTPISPGSSGGGLFDSTGRLIGITTMYWKDSQQINFAVPVEWVNELPRRSAKARKVSADKESSDEVAANAATAAQVAADEAENARLDLNALGAELQRADPTGYAGRYQELVKDLARIKQTLPPSQWADAARRAYDTIIRKEEDAADAAAKEAGRLALNALGVELEASDPDYAAKLPQLVSKVAIIKQTLPPGEWVKEARMAHTRIPSPSKVEERGVGVTDTWIPLGIRDGIAIGIDKRTISRNGTEVSFWLRGTQSTPKPFGGVPNVARIMQSYVIDCAGKTSKISQTALYSQTGNTISVDASPQARKEIIPDSLNWSLMTALCK